jgi:hypothetical protein
MYPLGTHSNLLRDSWYPLALRNQTFMTAILWSAADYSCGQSPPSWLNPKQYLESTLLQQLRDKVDTESVPSDGTISAVSCLAMTGVSSQIP